MIAIALPNGDSKNFERPITGLTVAESISKSLAKAAVAVRVNGELRDLTRNIEDNAAVEIITRDTPEGLEVIRHDTAHVFAEAIKELQKAISLDPDTSVFRLNLTRVRGN